VRIPERFKWGAGWGWGFRTVYLQCRDIIDLYQLLIAWRICWEGLYEAEGVCLTSQEYKPSFTASISIQHNNIYPHEGRCILELFLINL